MTVGLNVTLISQDLSADSGDCDISPYVRRRTDECHGSMLKWNELGRAISDASFGDC